MAGKGLFWRQNTFLLMYGEEGTELQMDLLQNSIVYVSRFD